MYNLFTCYHSQPPYSGIYLRNNCTALHFQELYSSVCGFYRKALKIRYINVVHFAKQKHPGKPILAKMYF